MKILCLHGRGSNNEIFRAQTAAFRADLDDFEWVFVQGTARHTEGNFSLYTSQFSHLPLYTYYNPFEPASILRTHADLEQIIESEGPFGECTTTPSKACPDPRQWPKMAFSVILAALL